MVYKVYAFRYSDELDIPDSLVEMWRATGGEDPLSYKVTMLQLYWTPGKSWERVAEVVVGAIRERDCGISGVPVRRGAQVRL